MFSVVGAVRDADQGAKLHARTYPVDVFWYTEVTPHLCSAKGSDVVRESRDWGEVFGEHAWSQIFETERVGYSSPYYRSWNSFRVTGFIPCVDVRGGPNVGP